MNRCRCENCGHEWQPDLPTCEECRGTGLEIQERPSPFVDRAYHRQAMEERDEKIVEQRERIEHLERELGAQTYRGNSVAYWHDKARAYGDMVHGINPALGAHEDEGPVDAAHRVVAERDQTAEALLAVSLGDATRDDVEALVDGRAGNVPLHANHGGCWFCGRSGAESFCKGWDAGYHLSCLEAEKKNNADNPELTEFP